MGKTALPPVVDTPSRASSDPSPEAMTAPLLPTTSSTTGPEAKRSRATLTQIHSAQPLKELLMHTTPSPPPQLLTLAELCAFLKVKRSYVYSLTSTDRIPHRKFAGTLRFVKAEILHWLNRGYRGPRLHEPPKSDS